MRYLHTDTILFQHDYPEALVRQQQMHWDPVIESVSRRLGVSFQTTTSLFSVQQAPETLKQCEQTLFGFSGQQLAAFEKAVMETKSFLLAFAFLEQHKLSLDEVVHAARLEHVTQQERWGTIEGTHDLDMQQTRRHLAAAALCFLHDRPASETIQLQE